jgi:hypothetical protein
VTPRRKTDGEREIPLRVTLVDPPPDVLFCLQRGRSELVSARRTTGKPESFDFTARAKSLAGGRVNLLGPFTQGPPAQRFVYVNSGTLAGDAGSCWSRRAKVALTAIDQALVDQVLSMPGARLEARIAGTARDGGPACASCKLLAPGWKVVRR